MPIFEGQAPPSQYGPQVQSSAGLPPAQTSALGNAMGSLSLEEQASSSSVTPESTSSQTSNEAPPLNDLNSEPRRRFIDAVDRLRELGVSKDVPLPQLVVIGDQSSGKSSLLEGLTGVAFPVANDVCTRFVTHFSMKHTLGTEDFLRVFITPGDKIFQDPTHLKQLKDFERVISKESLGVKENMDNLFADVAKVMGLPASTEENPSNGQQFSEHTLEIEFNGPNQTHLSVIDMPGLFHNTTAFQTERDRAFVIGAIKRYIKNQNTIILAVMDASNNLANQEVFKMAKEADPPGLRTIGIITKCDIVQRGDEPRIIRIAQNSVEILHHGWFAVRNRSTEDIQKGHSMKQRAETEMAFFSDSLWSALDRSRCGVAALKIYLAQVLYRHIRKQLPRIMQELERLHGQAQTDLRDMGEPRGTASAQRRYLAQIARNYERMLEDCLSGHYTDDLFHFSPLRLETHLLHLREEFRAQMAKSGHAHIFARPNNTIDDSYVDTGKKPFSFIPHSSHDTTPVSTRSSSVFDTAFAKATQSSTPVSSGLRFLPYTDRGAGMQGEKYQNISCLRRYRSFSPEELRLSGSTSSLSCANGTPQGTSLFDRATVPPATTSGFGPGLGGVGTSPNARSLFGQKTSTAPNDNPSTGMFATGATSSSSPFATGTSNSTQTAPTSSLFGGSTGNSAPAAPNSPLFGGSLFKPDLSPVRPEIYQWILVNFKSSRGMELPGTVNPDLVKSLFQQQTRSWAKIAEEYLSKIALAIHEYSLEAHRKLIVEEDVREKLLKRHLTHEDLMKRDAELELQRVLVDERENLTTVNQTYMDNLTLMREERVLSRLRSLGLLGEGVPNLDANVNVANVRSVLKAANPSWEEQAVHDIHDILKAYYEVARDRFMDNVVMAVIKRHMTGDASKLKLYNTTYVTRLKDDELADIAGENPVSASQRSELERKSAMYMQAMEVTKNL